MSLLQRKGLGLKGWVLAGAAAAVFAAGGMILGCGDEGDSNKPGDIVYNPDGSGGDSQIVGDWLMVKNVGSDGDVYERSSEYYKFFYRFTSSGKLMAAEFVMVENFWMGGEWDTFPGTWSANGQTGYRVSYDRYDDVFDTSKFSYSISGDEFTLTSCYHDDWEGDDKEYCYSTIFVKSNANAVTPIRSSGDPALYQAPYDLAWKLDGDESWRLDLDRSRFYDGDYYLDGGDGGYWYTTGTRLFLLYGEWYWDEDDNRGPFVVESKVELDYKVTGTGDDRVLTIRRVLPDGSLGDPDTWLPFSLGGDYDYAPAKSRQNVRPSSPFGNGKDSGKGNSLFPRPPARGR